MKACVRLITLTLGLVATGAISPVMADAVPTFNATAGGVEFGQRSTQYFFSADSFDVGGEDPFTSVPTVSYTPGQPIGMTNFSFYGPTGFVAPGHDTFEPYGDIAVGGVQYFGTRFVISGEVNLSPLVIAPILSAGGDAYVTTPATVTGAGTPCISKATGSYLCESEFDAPPDPIANIAIDLPGEFTLHFVFDGSDEFVDSASFVPTPEPSSSILVLAGIALMMGIAVRVARG